MQTLAVTNTLAVEIIMSSVKTQAAIFKSTFGVNQCDKVLHKQKSLGLRLKNIFPNEVIIEEYSALHCRPYFIFKKPMLVVETDEKGHVDRDPDYDNKRQKELEKLDYHLIKIIPDQMDFSDYEEVGRVIAAIPLSPSKKKFFDLLQ